MTQARNVGGSFYPVIREPETFVRGRAHPDGAVDAFDVFDYALNFRRLAISSATADC
jgi:hypothetical protein